MATNPVTHGSGGQNVRRERHLWLSVSSLQLPCLKNTPLAASPRRPSIQTPITGRAQRPRPLRGRPSATDWPMDVSSPARPPHGSNTPPAPNNPSVLPNATHDSNWILPNSVAAAAAAATLGLVINFLLLWSSAAASREEVQRRGEGGRR